MNPKIERLKVLTAGVLSLILMVGIARFAYTPLLPLMQQQAGLGVSEAGWLAAINYLGYLSGAILASFISDLFLKDWLYRLGLIVAVLTTLLMGITDNLWLWALSRYFAGLSSAAGMLLGSGLIMNWLIRHGHRSELGVHFAGLGLGIAFSAFVVELMNHYIDWSQQWYFLSIMGTLILIPAWRWLPKPDTSNITITGNEMKESPPSRAFLRLFMLAYFCAGVGYVVSATFIVAIVNQLPGMQGSGSWAFLILGLAAAPACIIWDLVARRIGNFNALISAFVLQIIGILLTVIESNFYVVLFGSALFGGTFIGIVSLVLSMAGRYYPTRPAKMMGKMTISYGVAQILAPAVTGILAKVTGNYDDCLYIAAIMMSLGTVMMIKLKSMEQRDLS